MRGSPPFSSAAWSTLSSGLFSGVCLLTFVASVIAGFWLTVELSVFTGVELSNKKRLKIHDNFFIFFNFPENFEFLLYRWVYRGLLFLGCGGGCLWILDDICVGERVVYFGPGTSFGAFCHNVSHMQTRDT